MILKRHGYHDSHDRPSEVFLLNFACVLGACCCAVLNRMDLQAPGVAEMSLYKHIQKDAER